jgi:hypothetical protein
VTAGGSSSPKRGFSFSARASQLWRFSLGSNAAVLKKIGLKPAGVVRLPGKDEDSAYFVSEG